MFQFTKQDCRKYIDRIHTLNMSLTIMNNKSLLSAEVGTYNSTEASVSRRYYTRVRMHAKILSETLEEKLQTSGCLCQVFTLRHF